VYRTFRAVLHLVYKTFATALHQVDRTFPTVLHQVDRTFPTALHQKDRTFPTALHLVYRTFPTVLHLVYKTFPTALPLICCERSPVHYLILRNEVIWRLCSDEPRICFWQFHGPWILNGLGCWPFNPKPYVIFAAPLTECIVIPGAYFNWI